MPTTKKPESATKVWRSGTAPATPSCTVGRRASHPRGASATSIPARYRACSAPMHSEPFLESCRLDDERELQRATYLPSLAEIAVLKRQIRDENKAKEPLEGSPQGGEHARCTADQPNLLGDQPPETEITKPAQR
jgi:hypothetical protein